MIRPLFFSKKKFRPVLLFFSIKKSLPLVDFHGLGSRQNMLEESKKGDLEFCLEFLEF